MSYNKQSSSLGKKSDQISKRIYALKIKDLKSIFTKLYLICNVLVFVEVVKAISGSVPFFVKY